MENETNFKSKKQQRKWEKKLQKFMGVEQYPKTCKNYNRKKKRIKKFDFEDDKCYTENGGD